MDVVSIQKEMEFRVRFSCEVNNENGLVSSVALFRRTAILVE